ncbi:MAG: mannose-1-phosphate guanylyltransferase [Planctomycetota bacterium]
MLHGIIMAGGSGTRFWPASRNAKPKQLLNLTGDETMIQSTFRRLERVIDPQRVSVITAAHLTAAIIEQLSTVPAENIVGEPCRRDTAPCVGIAAARVLAEDPDGIMLVCPADHVIQDHDAFANAVKQGATLLESQPGAIITFGIRPSYPAESFGYIQSGDSISEDGAPTFEVVRFREKPDRATAESYLESGNFYWNSGIFLWRADTIWKSLAKHEPEMYAHLDAIKTAFGTDNAETTFQKEFEAIDGKSIDYAVMERHPNVIVIEAPFDWDDVGSWQALSRLQPQDESGNAVIGSHIGIDTQDCIVFGNADHTIVTIDLDDLIVVQTGDATLVAPKSSEERVREAVAALKQSGRSQLT